MIKFENVNYSIDGKVIFDNINFEFEKGKYNVIIGENGSGKSTIIRLLLGLIEINSGNIYINNKKLEYKKGFSYELRKKIGVVFQEIEEQIIGERVIDNFIFIMENNNFLREKIDENIKKYSKIFNIENMLHKKIEELSSGEKEKIAICSVFLVEPEIIILDETLERIDNKTKKDVKIILDNYVKEGKSVILIKHNDEEIEQDNNVYLVKNKKVEKILFIKKEKRNYNFDEKKNNEIVFKIKNLYYNYNEKKELIKNKNFEINKNTITVISGKSATGKSTFFKLVLGLVENKENINGNIEIKLRNKNYNINKKTNEKLFEEIRKEVKIVFQNVEKQFFEKTVREEIEYNILKKYNLKKMNIELKYKMYKIMCDLGLKYEILKKNPFELSTGEKKLVGIVMALCTEPQILLLDEPTVSLDKNKRENLINYLEKIKNKTTVIIITNEKTLIEKYKCINFDTI